MIIKKKNFNIDIVRFSEFGVRGKCCANSSTAAKKMMVGAYPAPLIMLPGMTCQLRRDLSLFEWGRGGGKGGSHGT